MGSWGAPWASGRGCQAAQSSSLGMGGWSEEGRPEFTGVSCPEEGIILWLVEIHGAFSWRDLAALLIKECYVSTPSARHNLLIIDDLGSTEMLVVLKCVHMDLQSLQAPYLTFTFIVIQAFCSFFFSPFGFGLVFISTWWSHCRCLSCLPVWSGTAGYSAWCRQDGGSLCRAGYYLWECVTPHQAALSGSSISPGRSLFFVPSTFGGKDQSDGNGGSGASAIPAPGFASTGARMLLAQHRTDALQLPPCW